MLFGFSQRLLLKIKRRFYRVEIKFKKTSLIVHELLKGAKSKK